ncbi:hypothetical protein COM08_26490 [Bacillus wiedmannii]|nr:hypothetical protein COM08_26490 [Bacillus wiedmannii]PHE79620.1 hypothetical protein COF77_01750 [Bacillus wiedmannii]
MFFYNRCSIWKISPYRNRLVKYFYIFIYKYIFLVKKHTFQYSFSPLFKPIDIFNGNRFVPFHLC